MTRKETIDYLEFERTQVLNKSDGRESDLTRAYDMAIEELRKPERKHGQWEEIRNPYGDIEGWIHKDCGREVKCKESFCPNCGADMRR